MPSVLRQPAAVMCHFFVRYFDIDQATPGAVRRLMQWQTAGLLIVCLPFLVLVMLAAFGIISGLIMVLFPPLCIFIVLWGHYWDRAAKQRIVRAAAADHLLCPECLYDLRTLDATGTCPECGRPYEHAAVRAMWLDAERRLRRGRGRQPSDEPPA